MNNCRELWMSLTGCAEGCVCSVLPAFVFFREQQNAARYGCAC